MAMEATRMPQCGRGPRQTGPQALLFLDPKMSRFPIPYTLSEIESHSFTIASPCIHTDDDLTQFLRGASAQGYLSFVLFLNKSVSGLSNSNATSSKPCILHLVDMLQTLRSWVEDIPPLDKDAAPQRRFGNPAYRTWTAKVSEESLGLMRVLVETAPFHLSKAKIESIAMELTSYFINAFGNQTRIDYGTGHETCFVAMLYCMAKLGLLEEHDAKDIELEACGGWMTTKYYPFCGVHHNS